MALNLDDSSAGCVCHIVGLRVVHWHTEYTKGESDVHYHFHHAIGRQRCYWVTKKEQEFVNRIVRRRCWATGDIVLMGDVNRVGRPGNWMLTTRRQMGLLFGRLSGKRSMDGSALYKEGVRPMIE